MEILKQIWKFLLGIGIAVIAIFAFKKKSEPIPTPEDAINSAKLDNAKADIAADIKKVATKKAEIKKDISTIDAKIDAVDSEIKKVRKTAAMSKKATPKSRTKKG